MDTYLLRMFGLGLNKTIHIHSRFQLLPKPIPKSLGGQGAGTSVIAVNKWFFKINR